MLNLLDDERQNFENKDPVCMDKYFTKRINIAERGGLNITNNNNNKR